MAWMTSTSASRVSTVSPPGRSWAASAAIIRRVAGSQSEPVSASVPVRWTVAGSSSTSDRAAGWSNRTAPQTSVVAAPPPPCRMIA